MNKNPSAEACADTRMISPGVIPGQYAWLKMIEVDSRTSCTQPFRIVVSPTLTGVVGGAGRRIDCAVFERGLLLDPEI